MAAKSKTRVLDAVPALNAAATTEFPFKVRDEEFTATGEIPGIIVLKFVASQNADVDDANVMAAAASLEFLNHVVVEKDRKRWDSFLLRAKPVIGVEELMEISSNLLEEISGNPTEQSSDS